ncbi:MFS transporter [Achromobacter deleyi]|uniref:MFS transporter n=1 Tax=Achromobacter deleyi TaxID=1353891 RepID=UPI00149202F2|nr:MFS transporter [Achromobacter deleyi]QVQ26948.1 MFS transporter [Achromobacter deleyi]UIP22523.1 MFS transporter [Achromobacter deleyi]
MSVGHTLAGRPPIDSGSEREQIVERALKKVTWRLIPFLFVCYFFAYLDRVNVGFAKLQMSNALSFSEAIYGLGAGIFFIGYFLFEVPSNMILHRVGARRWIARIMISWGLISAAMMFVQTPAAFYVLRFLLGVAEAGFFPGIILYLTYWFPAARRGRITALFMAAIPVSGIIGGPLSGWILDHFDGSMGMDGWQWLFLLEGLPTVFIGISVLFVLTDRVNDATWLTGDEKQALTETLNAEANTQEQNSFVLALKDRRVWTLCMIYFCIQMGVYAISFWLPTLIKASGIESSTAIGLVSAVPYIAAAITMLIIGYSADRKRERRWHLIVPVLMAGIGVMGAAYFPPTSMLALASLTLATMGFFTALPMFWPLPSAFLGGMAAAGGLAMINSFGNLAGFVSPYLVGWVRTSTGSAGMALYILAGIALIGAVLILTIPARSVNR